MAGAGGTIHIEGEARLTRTLQKLINVDTSQLLNVLANIVESQTRTRLTEDKTSPDGVPWPEWSPLYAITRHGNQSLLENQGHLLDSIQSLSNMNTAEVGSNLIYVATHQYGDKQRNIPQRELLGIGTDNMHDLQQTLDDWADNFVQELA